VVLLRSLNIALMTLRNCGLAHLDLKPANVLVDGHGTGPHSIYLSDFGHSLKWAEMRDPLYCCSRNYRAPELLLGLSFDWRADIFSLAVIALDTLLGFSVLTADSAE